LYYREKKEEGETCIWQPMMISNLSIHHSDKSDVKQLKMWHWIISFYPPTGIWKIDFLTEKIFQHDSKFRTAISGNCRLSGNSPNLIEHVTYIQQNIISIVMVF